MVFSGYSVSSTNKADRHNITEILLKVALNTTNLIYKHLTLTRPIHVPIDIMALEIHTNVMMVNWIPKRQYRLHDGLSTLSFTIVIVSSEEGQDKKQML